MLSFEFALNCHVIVLRIYDTIRWDFQFLSKSQSRCSYCLPCAAAFLFYCCCCYCWFLCCCCFCCKKWNASWHLAIEPVSFTLNYIIRISFALNCLPLFISWFTIWTQNKWLGKLSRVAFQELCSLYGARETEKSKLVRQPCGFQSRASNENLNSQTMCSECENIT